MSRVELPELDASHVSASFPMEVEFDGPPQASFLLMGKRAVYETFMLVGAPAMRDEMMVAFSTTLADMKSRGGKYLFWRRRPAYEYDEGGEHPLKLRARLAVLTESGEQIRMRIGKKEEGALATLIS